MPKHKLTPWQSACKQLGYLQKGKAFKPLPKVGTKEHKALTRLAASKAKAKAKSKSKTHKFRMDTDAACPILPGNCDDALAAYVADEDNQKTKMDTCAQAMAKKTGEYFPAYGEKFYEAVRAEMGEKCYYKRKPYYLERKRAEEKRESDKANAMRTRALEEGAKLNAQLEKEKKQREEKTVVNAVADGFDKLRRWRNAAPRVGT